MLFTHLTRQTLPEQVAENLIDFIASQGLKPGDLLPSTAKLAESFGVSRPVVREGLRSLASLGIIEIVNGKGAIVKPIDGSLLYLFFQRAIQLQRRSVMELMEVRKPLEIQSASLAADRHTPKDLAKIEETVVAMARGLHDLETYANLDVEFHLTIAATTRNTMMFYLISSIRESLEGAVLQGLHSRRSQMELERVQQTHELVFEGIKVRDPEMAAEMMAVHFDEAIEALLREENSQALAV
jgi:GntR family transcriptional repressor for pyruvate dehydrogenase complex